MQKLRMKPKTEEPRKLANDALMLIIDELKLKEPLKLYKEPLKLANDSLMLIKDALKYKEPLKLDNEPMKLGWSQKQTPPPNTLFVYLLFSKHVLLPLGATLLILWGFSY